MNKLKKRQAANRRQQRTMKTPNIDFYPILQGEMMDNKNCIHNQRTRYTDGFFCKDCSTFFGNDSPTYRSGELMSDLWMVLNNINVGLSRGGQERDPEVSAMIDEIGICVAHENYEEIITKAEKIMNKYQKDSNSASITLG